MCDREATGTSDTDIPVIRRKIAQLAKDKGHIKVVDVIPWG
jgi:hypothetical protein